MGGIIIFMMRPEIDVRRKMRMPEEARERAAAVTSQVGV